MKTTFCLSQDKFQCICLGLVQPKKPVWLCNVDIVQCIMYTTIYSVHIVHSVQCTHCTNPTTGTESAVLWWEGPLGRALLPFPSFQGFHWRPRDATPPSEGKVLLGWNPKQNGHQSMAPRYLYNLADKSDVTNCAANPTWIQGRLWLSNRMVTACFGG